MQPETNLSPVDIDDSVLISELRPALVAFFRRRCGNAAEAEDLTQDVILRALTHARWTSEEQAKGYIFKIAINRWRDRGRRLLTHAAETDWNDDHVEGVTEEISLERVLDGQDEIRLISAALDDMEERTRDIFILCRLEQMKQTEIADMLGISISSVEKHLVKALTLVSSRMNQHAG